MSPIIDLARLGMRTVVEVRIARGGGVAQHPVALFHAIR